MSKFDILAYNIQGQSQNRLEIDLEIEKREESPKTYATVIRALVQNWRQGTVGCKDRSEVSYANRKPWKQKGTGRARAGSLRSPVWRKGGVTFGPQPRVRELSVNDKQKKLVFNNIFFAVLNNNGFHCLDFSLDKQAPSTKAAFNVLKTAGLNDKKKIIFLPFADNIHFSSFRNIPNVTILSFDQPNAFDLSDCGNWVFLKKDLDLFKKMVARWN